MIKVVLFRSPFQNKCIALLKERARAGLGISKARNVSY